MRQNGSHVRVSAQLTEAETGGSIWAERYDRDIGDVLVLQDQIAEEVAGAIEPELLRTEGQRGAERSRSLTAWDLVRRGVWEFHKIRPDSHQRARELFLKAIAAEPNSADGYIWLARVEAGLAAYGWGSDSEASLRSGIEAGLKAVELDAKNPYSHYAVAVTHVFGGEYETAIRAAQRATSLSPSFALGYLVLGPAYLSTGRLREAIETLEHGLRLSPYDPQNFSWLFLLSAAYSFSGNAEAGLDAARRALSVRPHWIPALKMIVLCCTRLGELEQARSAASQVRSATVAEGDLARLIPSPDPAWIEEIEQAVRNALRNGRVR